VTVVYFIFITSLRSARYIHFYEGESAVVQHIYNTCWSCTHCWVLFIYCNVFQKTKSSPRRTSGR